MSRCYCFAMVLPLAIFAAPLAAEEPLPAEIIASFAAADNDAAWMPDRPYMRRLDDATWKGRMIAMHKLVAAGERSVPALLEALESKDDATRVFAAQTIGYLAEHAPRERLLKIAKSDPNPAVRLYAVDAIGTQGGDDPAAELALLKKNEENRDVLKHIGYAMERNGQGIAAGVVEALADWDPSNIDTAEVGKRAPDFQLSTPEGERIRLSEFRGKRAVVLVFIYGDT